MNTQFLITIISLLTGIAVYFISKPMISRISKKTGISEGRLRKAQKGHRSAYAIGASGKHLTIHERDEIKKVDLGSTAWPIIIFSIGLLIVFSIILTLSGGAPWDN